MDSIQFENQRAILRNDAPNLTDLTYLVTGGCGFVGSRITKLLTAYGAKCYVLDNLYTGRSENVKDTPNIEVIIGDVRDEVLLRNLLPNCQRVVHCATVNIIAAQTDAQQDLMVNAAGTQLLSALCGEFSNINSMIYTSSASVYGNSNQLPTPEESWFNPLSYYAVSKLAGEQYCRIEHINNGAPISILRLSNVFGPHQRPNNPFCGVVAKIYESLKNEKKVTVFGSGEQTRDFTYVDDVADAVILASTNPKAVGKVFNVASGMETRVVELVSMMANLMAVDGITRQATQRSIDNIDRRCLDVQKINDILGWQAKTPLSVGLRRTVRWLNEQEPSISPVLEIVS